MATIINVPKSPNQPGAAFGQGVARATGDIITELKEKRERERLQAALVKANSAENKAAARVTLSPFINDSDDALAIEKILTARFAPDPGEELVNAIQVSSGQLTNIPKNQLNKSGVRAAPKGTKNERLFKDQKELILVGAFAQGAVAGKGLLTAKEHEQKYGAASDRAPGKVSAATTKLNAQVRNRLRAFNSRNPESKKNVTVGTPASDAAIDLIENDSLLIKTLNESFSKALGFNFSFAEEDVPIRNRAIQIVEDLMIGQSKSMADAVEEAITQATAEISEEELAKLKAKAAQDAAINGGVEEKEGSQGVLSSVLDSVMETFSGGDENGSKVPGAGVEKVPGVDTPQDTIPYTLLDGTPVRVDIPQSIDLSKSDGKRNLFNYLVGEKKFSEQEAVKFIQDNYN